MVFFGVVEKRERGSFSTSASLDWNENVSFFNNSSNLEWTWFVFINAAIDLLFLLFWECSFFCSGFSDIEFDILNPTESFFIFGSFLLLLLLSILLIFYKIYIY